MKIVLSVLGLALLAVIGFAVFAPQDTPEQTQQINEQVSREAVTAGERSVVADGQYAVLAEASQVNWAGKKPLIDGYVNSGSIALTDGSITVADDKATGEFTIDMNTLSVSNTPTKPGAENTLEGHLKGKSWFNVEEFPQASFEITKVTERADSDATLTYDVTGELTMKGETHELAFPAIIYMDAEGRVYAQAETEFDRTKWGITSGSGSFFDSLADNVIDDMVALSFSLVAEKQ